MGKFFVHFVLPLKCLVVSLCSQVVAHWGSGFDRVCFSRFERFVRDLFWLCRGSFLFFYVLVLRKQGMVVCVCLTGAKSAFSSRQGMAGIIF